MNYGIFWGKQFEQLIKWIIHFLAISSAPDAFFLWLSSVADQKPGPEPQSESEPGPIVRMSCTYYKVIEKHNRLF